MAEGHGEGSRNRRAGRGIARFGALFAVYALAGYGLLNLPGVDRGLVGPWTRADIGLTVWLVRPLGVFADASGTVLAGGGAALDVSKGCDGTTALLLLVSSILAFPASWSARGWGVLLGAAGVFVINAVRLATLLLVAIHWPGRLEFFHIDVWQPIMMLAALGLFLAWGALLASRSSQKLLGSG
jgi:exosortase/archaeosortase family protein